MPKGPFQAFSWAFISLRVSASDDAAADRKSTRSMLQTDQQFPGIDNNKAGLKQNADGSYDIYFGPKAPAGLADNWIQTVPEKGWNTILRLYGPTEAWFDKTWRPGEIVLVE